MQRYQDKWNRFWNPVSADKIDWVKDGRIVWKVAVMYNVQTQSFSKENLDMERLLANLHTAILQYLYNEQGYRECDLSNMPAMMDKEESNVSVIRARNLRDFLIHFPRENTYRALIEDLCFLWSGQQEYPLGLANSRGLRGAIIHALDAWYKTQQISNVSDLISNYSPFSFVKPEEGFDMEKIINRGNQQRNTYIFYIMFAHRYFADWPDLANVLLTTIKPYPSFKSAKSVDTKNEDDCLSVHDYDRMNKFC